MSFSSLTNNPTLPALSELERPAYDKVKEDENLKKAVAEGSKQASKAAAGGLSPIAAKYP